MTKQLDLNLSGKELKLKGMNKAIDSANRKNAGWQDMAYGFLIAFIASRREPFMTEQVRLAAANVVPEPVSKRAWGGIIARAANAGLIKKVGHNTVTNPKAHNCFASVWKSVLQFDTN